MSLSKLETLCSREWCVHPFIIAGLRAGALFPSYEGTDKEATSSSPYFYLIPFTFSPSEFGLYLINQLKPLSWNSSVLHPKAMNTVETSQDITSLYHPYWFFPTPWNSSFLRFSCRYSCFSYSVCDNFVCFLG